MCITFIHLIHIYQFSYLKESIPFTGNLVNLHKGGVSDKIQQLLNTLKVLFAFNYHHCLSLTEHRDQRKTVSQLKSTMLTMKAQMEVRKFNNSETNYQVSSSHMLTRHCIITL